MERSVVTINDIIIYHPNPPTATLCQGIDRWTGLLWQDGRDQTGRSLWSDPARPTVTPPLCKRSHVREVLPQAWGRCLVPGLAGDRCKWEATPRMLKGPGHHGYCNRLWGVSMSFRTSRRPGLWSMLCTFQPWTLSRNSVFSLSSARDWVLWGHNHTSASQQHYELGPTVAFLLFLFLGNRFRHVNRLAPGNWPVTYRRWDWNSGLCQSWALSHCVLLPSTSQNLSVLICIMRITPTLLTTWGVRTWGENADGSTTYTGKCIWFVQYSLSTYHMPSIALGAGIQWGIG